METESLIAALEREHYVLTSAEAEQQRAFLDSGELPEGWVCAKAQAGHGTRM